MDVNEKDGQKGPEGEHKEAPAVEETNREAQELAAKVGEAEDGLEGAEAEVKDLLTFECPHCHKVFEVLIETLDEIGVDYYEGFAFTCDDAKCNKKFLVKGW